MMGFIRSFFGTCCGTAAFPKLCRHSVVRVLWHFFLLELLCAFLIGVGNYYLLKFKWRVAEDQFGDDFGASIRFDRDGVRPQNRPEVSRRQEFPYETLLIYVSPKGAEKDYPDETLIARNYILLWHPSCFVLLAQSGKEWSSITMNSDFSVTTKQGMSFQDMKSFLREMADRKPEGKWSWPWDLEQNGMSTRRLFHQFRITCSVSESVILFIHQTLMTLFCTLVFAGIFRLFSRRKLPELSFGKVWKAGMYVAMPVILVVSLFPALQLPGTHLYDHLFMVGWAIYMFFVLRYIVLFRDEDNETEPEK